MQRLLQRKTVCLLLCYFCFLVCLQAQPRLFYSDLGTSLYQVDLANCSQKLITPDLPVTMMDIALCPNGYIYGTDGLNFYKIDTLTGSTSMDYEMQDSVAFFNGLDCDDENRLVASSPLTKDLFLIEPENGYVTEKLCHVGIGSAGDLVDTKHDIYLISIDQHLLRIDKQNNYSVKDIGYVEPCYALYGLGIYFKESNCGPEIQLIGGEINKFLEIDENSAASNYLCTLPEFSYVGGIASYPFVYNGSFIDQMIVPNVFTPNSDGLNDVFFPEIVSPECEFRLEIYNRWGLLVKELSETDMQWDGSINGQPATDGVYQWILTDAKGGNTRSGFLQVLR